MSYDEVINFLGPSSEEVDHEKLVYVMSDAPKNYDFNAIIIMELFFVDEKLTKWGIRYD